MIRDLVCKTLITFIVISGFSHSLVASADNLSWGSELLTNTQRPDHTWLSQFDGITPIPVATTVENALGDCPATGYCVIEIDQLNLSGTVFLDRPKTKLIGKAGNKITYSVSAGASGAFFEMESGIQEIVLENLHLDGESIDYAQNPIFGFLLQGSNINKIAIIGNHIHHLFSDVDGHGIGIYGTGATESSAVKNIIIDNNNLHNLRTGSSESIAINGNVKHWEITNNQVSHINNIAIDAIGGEGTSPVQTINGRVLPGVLDAARFGFIENNSVIDMSTLTNPAYGSKHSWAGGIYIDGGRSISIANNTVSGSEWAYDVGAENCVTTAQILLDNNTASNSYYGDLYVGGYAVGGYKENLMIECDPNITVDVDEGHGYIGNITIKNNQLDTTPPLLSTVFLEKRIRESIIIHTGVQAQHPDGSVTGDQNSIRITEQNDLIKRVEISKPILQAIYGAEYNPPNATGTLYTDVKSGDFNASWMEKLANDGITEGCSSTHFCPYMVVTKEQLAKILLKAKHGSGYTPPAPSGSVFDDVPANIFSAGWIEELFNQSITEGCNANNFCPKKAVTVKGFETMLDKSFP